HAHRTRRLRRVGRAASDEQNHPHPPHARQPTRFLAPLPARSYRRAVERALVRLWLMRLLGAGLLMALLAYVPYLVYRGDGYVHYRDMQDRLAEIERKNDAQRAQNRALRREVKRLRDDPAALTAVARDELGLVLPGEIVIQIEKP